MEIKPAIAAEYLVEIELKRYAAYYVRLGRKGTYINDLLKTVKTFRQLGNLQETP